MTSWGRGLIAVLGGVVLALTLAVQLGMAFLFTLCGLSDSAPDPGSWCAVSDGAHDAVLVTPMALSVASYAWTVWKVRLTPVLLGRPLLTAIWVGVLFAIYSD